MNSKIAVVTINYYDIANTIECLQSIQKSKASGKKITTFVINIADAGKPSNQGKHIAKQFPSTSVRVIEADNLGFSGSNNLGITQAQKDSCDTIILLNNDTTVHKDTLRQLHAKLAQKTIGAISPKIYFYPGQEFHHDSYKQSERGKVIWYAGGHIDWRNMYGSNRGIDEVDHGQFDQSSETDFATGCCFATRSDVIDRVGLLDEDYFLYWEDTDWSQRIRRAGYKVCYEPSGIVWHKNAGSTKGSGSPTHQYYQTRNRLLFGMKYGQARVKLALIKESVIKSRRSHSQAEKQAIRDYFVGRRKKGNL